MIDKPASLAELELPPETVKPALAFNGICKGFDGIPVLRDLMARFLPGTVNVLAGENGAGKSTLFKIISGQLTPDRGVLTIHGTPVHSFVPRHAQKLGISIIPQELLPIPDMKVWQNLLVGRERTRTLGFLRRGDMVSEARRLLGEFGLDIDPDAPMRRLGVAATQIIEIIKATSRDSTIVLMDEPSSSWPPPKEAMLQMPGITKADVNKYDDQLFDNADKFVAGLPELIKANMASGKYANQ